MRKSLSLSLLPIFALGGCALFGVGKERASDFGSARNSPLIIPPDYALNPPAAETPSRGATGARQQAVEPAAQVP